MLPLTYRSEFKGRVLVVEDNTQLLGMLGSVLQDAGYEVAVARNGVEGLRKFRAGSWDVVLTDRDLPEMDGEQMAAEIKSLAPATPVILVTGFPNKVARRTLFVGIFPKPYTSAVIDFVHEVLPLAYRETAAAH
jgi:CheY-like chemotaxis protein